TGLAAVILQMLAAELGDVASFPFLTPPDARGIRDGLDLLTELGAIRPRRDGARRRGGRRGAGAADAARGTDLRGAGTRPRDAGGVELTRIGRDLVRIPLDPRFGRMVVASRREGVSDA